MSRGIFKQRKSRYWYISYANVNGEIQRKSSKSTRKADAEAFLRQMKMEVDDGRNPNKRPIPNVTLAEFSPEYLRGKQEKQRSFDRTVRTVKQLAFDFRNIPLNQFTYALVEDWVNERLERNKYATVYRYFAVLKNMFKVAKNRRKMSVETFENVMQVKMSKPKNGRLRYLKDEKECDRLIDECYGHLKSIVIMALNTGMRLGEILLLRWQNVDFHNNRINLDASMTKSSEIRSIPMTKMLKSTLKSIERKPHIDYVFFNPQTEKRLTDIHHSFNNALKRAKITDFRFHDLRHTFATHFYMRTHDIRALQEILGHESLQMTLRYAQICDSHIEDGMRAFEGSVSGKCEVVNL